MHLTSLEADRLRNLKVVSLRLPEGLTLVTGRNGQGKTALLEAIYLLGTGRSFRTRRLDELVSWQGGPLRVAASVDHRQGDNRLTVVVDDNARSLLVDGEEQDLVSFIGRLDVVDLTAERMAVLRGAPPERRRFLDRGIVGLRPAFLRTLGEYRRVLQQRNALLRTAHSDRQLHAAQLDVWDERLVQAAGELHRRRREYAVRLAGELGEISRLLLDNGAQLGLEYRPSPCQARDAEPARFEEVFAEALARGRGKDLALGHTFQGPHRDGLGVDLDGVDLRKFGSAGQVRAAMIALKLGKLSLVRKDREEAPLFLLDDFDSDVDEGRATVLARYLRDGGFQALVATSKEAMAERLGVSFMKIRMDAGVARAG